MDSFANIQPSPALAPYIKNYWTLEVTGNGQVMERVIPTGFLQLVFHRGSRMFSSSDNDFQPQSFFCGQSAAYTDLSAMGRVHMIVVTFRPSGAKAFFRMPMNELYDQSVSLSDFAEKDLSELEDKIYNAKDNDTAIRLIESYLISRLRDTDQYHSARIREVVKTIDHNRQANITALADIACLSYKQFGRVFTEYVGTTPKEFSRIIRFQRALHILHHQPDTTPVDLAVECGYYDQPHLIREFKAFSGYTPNEFAAICQPYSDYFSEI